MVIYIVRHGQTEENLQRILQGHMPGTLTDMGKEQVAKTAERLAQMNVNFKCIVSSDLKRAVDSANIIADRLNLPIVTMEILRERDWGKFTGMSIAEARDKYRINDRWEFPEGTTETEEGIFNRAEETLSRLSELYHDDTIIVVTHGQFARNMVAAHLKCSYHEVSPFVNAEIRTITIS